MRRVFTKWLGYTPYTVPNEWHTEIGDAWIPQEDITIVGVLLQCFLGFGNSNDCEIYGHMEVSQAGVHWQDGIIACACYNYRWNTSPQAVYSIPANVPVMFPTGYGIPVKEEGHINLITNWYQNGAAGNGAIHCDAIIYYVKGKS
ncbi:hypothetical protein ES708_29527 [subsurface metagenome]